MKDDYRVLLNFLPAVGSLPQFRIFRKPRLASELRPDKAAASYSFAKDSNRDDRMYFWVKSEPTERFVEYVAGPDENNDLTRWALSHALRDAVHRNLDKGKYLINDRGFLDEISRIMQTHPEGREILVLQPYYSGSRKLGHRVSYSDGP
jgi:hypothetical protein